MTTTTPPPEPCSHIQFHAEVTVERDTMKVYVVAHCTLCLQKVIFPGMGERGMLQAFSMSDTNRPL